MKSKFKIWLIAVVIIGISVNVGMYIYVKIAQYNAKILFEHVRNHNKLYVYETYFNALNAAMYVKDLKDTSALISYYDKVAKHDTSAIINFEINSMPISMHEPVYVYRYFNKNSKIIELIDFDVRCWGYVRGYLYKATTHTRAPSDSLIKAKEAFLFKYNEDNNVRVRNNTAKKISDYGWYCNN